MSDQNQSALKKASPAAFENFLKAKYERLAGLTRTRSYPYVMIVDPSSICQLRCPVCYTGIVNELRRKERTRITGRQPTRLARSIIDSILEECGDLLFYCHFYNWSEPLLNNDLPEFISAASIRDIYTKVDTNLSLRLTDAKLNDLLLSGLNEIAASIDGFSQQTYERYRRGGRFELALENLTRLAVMRNRLGLDTRIIWNFLVFEFNEHEVPDILAFCQQHNVDFNPRDPVVYGPYTEWLPAYRREGKPNPHRARRAAELRSSEWVTPAGLIPRYVGRPDSRSCAWHYSYTTVNADGGVLPCCGLYRKRSDFGTVNGSPGAFGRVWNNANFAAARSIFPNAAAQVSEYPIAECAQCTRADSFRDHYTMLDREIIRKYWSFPDGSNVRQFDELYMLLQRSPAAFAADYAARYEAAVASEIA
jgi:MoaA/NifB/PqqE/SkfB family radical SAM enzyme